MPFSGSANFDIAADWRLLGLRLQLVSAAGRALIGLQYPPAGDHVHVMARLDGVRVGSLARATPALASLAGVDVPISGEIEGNAASAQEFKLTRLDLTGGAGRIELPGILPRPIKVAGTRLDATFSDDGAAIDIKNLSLDFGGPRLQATGVAGRP